MKKYIVAPGYVVSRSDGDRHYISAERLVWLYGVKMSECIIYYSETSLRGYYEAFIEGLTWLYPREDGNYVIS